MRRLSWTGETSLNLIDKIISTRGGRARWRQQLVKNSSPKARISFAFSHSTSCYFSRLISRCASDDVLGARPASISARFFNNRNVSAFTPAAQRHGCPQGNQTRDRHVFQRASEEHGPETRPVQNSIQFDSSKGKKRTKPGRFRLCPEHQGLDAAFLLSSVD